MKKRFLALILLVLLALVLPMAATADQRLPGDANGDGEVDIVDAMLVLRYTCGWGVDINRANCDVNADGDVDIADAMLILRYTCGWDVTLQPTSVYILNTNTMKFHVPGCSSADKIKPENKATSSKTRQELMDMGYSPCGNCHP